MRALLAAILAVSFCDASWAQTTVTSEAADKTWLTIYPDNLAMIVERRVIDVPAGQSTIRFMGVSDQIVPQTSVLQSFEGLTLESNFDGDLITRGALLDKAIGETLTVRRMNPKTGEESLLKGRLVSAANRNEVVQGIVLETPDGVEALECSGLSEALIFNGLPKGLSAKPVLSMDVDSEVAGEKEIFLSYLSRGIGWEADYRLDVGADQKGEGPLTGWLTVTNKTAKSFKDTPTAIVAGELNMTGNTKPDIKVQKTFTPGCWAAGSTKRGTRVNAALYKYIQPTKRGKYTFWDGSSGDDPSMAPARPVVAYSMTPEPAPAGYGGARMAEEEELGDYKLYRTPQPVTVAAMQTKQIAFIGIDDAEYEKVHKFDFDFWVVQMQRALPMPMTVEYELDNSKEGKLGKALPKGNVRLMTQRGNGKTAYLGESTVRNLAVDLPVEIELSSSPSVQVLPKVSTRLDGAGASVMLNADVLNANPFPILAEIEFRDEYLRYIHFSDESQARKADTIIPTYRFAVAAESREKLTLEIPVDIRSSFTHAHIKYLSGPDQQSYQKSNAARTFEYKDEKAPVLWAMGLRDENLPMIDISARILNRSSETDENQIEKSIIEEEIVFENTGDGERIFEFKIQDPNKFELLDASQEPDPNSGLQWTFIVPANGSFKLRVKTKGFHQI